MKPLKTAETQLREILEKDGWTITHKGWPDFACVRNGEMMFVEVKKYKGEMLKTHQHYILTNLAKLGLDCYKWTPNGGFERITPATPQIVEKPKRKKSGQPLTKEYRWSRLSLEEQKQISSAEADGKTWYY